MDKNEHIEKAEDLLKTFKVINETETIYDFLSKPYDEIDKALKEYFKKWRDFLKPIPNVQNDRLLIGYIPTLMSFTSAFYYIHSTTESQQIKANCDRVREHIGRDVISELNPYIVSFFKWDFQRRAWKHDYDEYKINYLQKVVDEIDKELKGEQAFLIKKYVGLLLEFVLEKYSELPIDDFDFSKYKMKKEDVFRTRNMIKQFIEMGKLGEVIDEDAEKSFSSLYNPHAENYLEGLIRIPKEFDYLFVAFIEAQNDYKKFISGILSLLLTTGTTYLLEIRTALNNKDIDRVIVILRALFGSVPHQLLAKTNEAYYHIFVHLILKLIGCDIVSEVSTNIGRIDAVVKFERIIYIFEFKTSTSEVAIDQIKMKKYAESFFAEGKEIYGLGLSFNKEEKNVNKAYILEEIKP